MNRAIVFLNGELKGDDEFYHNFLSTTDEIFCADGGAKYAYQLNLIPNLILGDLDSISDKIIQFYQDYDVEIRKFPVKKDKSDAELLLEFLLTKDYGQIILLAALGGRFDHALSNLYLLEGVFNEETEVKIITPNNQIEIIKDKKIISKQCGAMISLLSLSEKVSGVNLSGFKYELENGSLQRGNTLGLSNIIKDESAIIEIETGTLLLLINS
ncbi:MAG: thiamine diphosphokinase [Bacillota bacterium]